MTIADKQAMDKATEGGQGGVWIGRRFGRPSPISRDFLILAISLLIAAAGFGLGILVGREGAPKGDPGLWIEQLPKEDLPAAAGSALVPATQKPATSAQKPAATQTSAEPALQSGEVVASKTGSVYYLPDCAGAKRLKDENKVWFATKADAEAKGYKPSSSCKGL